MPRKKKSDIKPKKIKQSTVKKELKCKCSDTEPNNVKQFYVQDKPEYKCFSFFDNDPFHYKIYNELGKISKNVYNLSIYSIQVFNYFKLELYANLKNELEKDINFDTYKYINSKLIHYFDLYSSLKDKLKGKYSLRVGVYRIIYSFQRSELVIYVLDIGHRREIYR